MEFMKNYDRLYARCSRVIDRASLVICCGEV